MPQTDASLPNLNLLHTLLALLEERSVTRAATRLRLTQPAVSRSLQQLRDLTGDPLLVREGRAMSVTRRGEELLEPARQALSGASAVLGKREAFDPRIAEGVIRIATSDHVELALMPSFGELLMDRAPKLVVHVLSVEPTFAPLRDGAVDFVIGPFDDAPAELRREALFEEPFACILRSSERARRRMDLDEYLKRQHVLVAPRGRPSGVVDEELAKLGRERKVARVVPHFLVAPLIVSRSEFCATLPESVARALARAYKLDVVKPPLRLPRVAVSTVWHARRESDPLHAWTREMLRMAAARGLRGRAKRGE